MKIGNLVLNDYSMGLPANSGLKKNDIFLIVEMKMVGKKYYHVSFLSSRGISKGCI